MTDYDDIELSIHHEAWQAVERILDQRRRKVTLHTTVNDDGQLILHLPPEIEPGEYMITVIFEAVNQD